jgi:hypothetical protein
MIPERRKVLRNAVSGVGLAAACANELGGRWVRPAVNSVLLPAHAQTSVTGPAMALAPALTGNVEITTILWLQTASTDPAVLVDEYVDIVNNDTVSIELAGWQLMDSGPFTLTFPSRVIAPGESCRIYAHAVPGLQPCEFTFGRTSPGGPGNYVFNNTGDSATLTDASGTVIDTCSYTPADPSPFSC